MDDNPAIHEDFKKILCESQEPANETLAAGKALLFGRPAPAAAKLAFTIDSAFQGAEGLEMVQRALAADRPYALAFVDVRMPPGWDGIQTVRRLWEFCPDLQVVICTAYSDYSWEEMNGVLGHSDNLVILKKPFDNIEVLQLAHALTRKWNLARQVGQRTRHLQNSEERFAKAFRANPLPMAIQVLRDGRFIDVNASFVQLAGHTRHELIGRSPESLNLWPAGNGPAEWIAQLLRGESIRSHPVPLRTKLGKVRDALVSAELFQVDDEPCLLTLTEDITERLRLEAQFQQAQKMEAVGQLAAGIAHDFNNLLTIVQGHISLVLARPELEERSSHWLRQALQASERAGRLTRQLLAFSRKQVIERRPLSVRTLLEPMHDMLLRLIGDQIRIRFFCPDGLPPIHADRCNLEQVLLNLAVNARDAMPLGGDLSITASEVVFDADRVSPHPEAVTGHFVRLTVQDTGTGMDEATCRRVFEPFFTTKEFGKGTGMGLATVHGIVKQHHGWIELESQPGCGTEFRIHLPVSLESSGHEVDQPEPAGSPDSCRGATILVVEDEPLLLEFVTAALEHCGHRVLTAGNAAEALHVWREWGQEITLLLTDIVMPGGMTGKALAEQLRGERPDLRVIYTTGYSVDLIRDESELDPEIALLQKPYPVNVLVQTVQSRLAAPRSPAIIMNKQRPMTEVA